MINRIVDKISDNINIDEGPLTVTYLNVYNYTLLRKNKTILPTFDKITLDGILLVIMIRLLFGKRIRRVSPDFSSYFKPLFEDLNKSRQKVAFVGASEDDIQAFVKIIKDKYRDIQIGFYHNGYDVDEEFITSQLRDKQIEFLFVGMGTPKQEQLILDIRSSGYSGWSFCCGAFISQTANGGENYYPAWINSLHLRWLYRIYREPKLMRRYALDYPFGILLLLKDRLSKRDIY